MTTTSYDGISQRPAKYNQDLEYGSENNASNKTLSANERAILEDVLYFDAKIGSDAEFQGTYSSDTNLAVQLQYVSDEDINNYVTAYNTRPTLTEITFNQVKSVFTEARNLSKQNTSYKPDTDGNGKVDSDIASIEEVQNALGSNMINIMLLESYVTAYDKEDGQGLSKVTAGDLHKFANFYNLTDAQRETLVLAYSDIAEIQTVTGANNNKIIPKTTQPSLGELLQLFLQ